MIIDPVAAAVAFAVVLLVWATALLFHRTVIPYHHIWLFTAAFIAFFTVLLLVTAEQRSF
jgi:hypothetical protein